MIAEPQPASADARLATIARLNDRCRYGLDRTGRIMMTRTCIGAIAPDGGAAAVIMQARLLAALRRYEFSAAEAGERDRGSFDFDGTTVYFRIDYYDTALEFGSEDSAEASMTRRVLTIMVREDI